MFLSFHRSCIIIAFSFTVCLSNNLTAATLSIADNLVLRELDDQRLDAGFFSDSFTTIKNIQLLEGSHTLLIKYKDVYEDLDFAEERLVESELFIVKFRLSDQQSLKLLTPKIKNLSAAEKFSQAPEIMLVDEHNSALTLQLEKYNDYKLAKQVTKVVTALPISDITIKEIEQTKVSKKSLAVTLVESASTTEQQFTKQVLTHTESLPMLKYWWQKASAQEKQDFIIYVKGDN